MPSRRVSSLLLAAMLALLCSGCAGFVNARPGLRWWLFKNFGASKVCPEMVKRGSAPLKLSPNGNVIGRFYPSGCRHEVNDEARTMTMHFQGMGYAWQPVAGRMFFTAEASIEFRFDFYLGEEADYVWAKTNRIIYGPKFNLTSIENKVVQIANQSPLGFITNTFGSQVASSQLASGFTVVRTGEGEEFTLGILQPPQRPKKPFNLEEGDRYIYANETTEVRSNQIDFLGPFTVEEDDQALFLRFRVQGPAVDAMIFPRGTGDLWRDALQKGIALGPPPQAPLRGFPVQPGPEARHKVKLPPGQYYVVVDNSDKVGVVQPPWSPLGMVGANVAIVSYTAEIGDQDDKF